MDQDNLTLIATDAEPQEDALTVKCGGLEGSFGFEHLRYRKTIALKRVGLFFKGIKGDQWLFLRVVAIHVVNTLKPILNFNISESNEMLGVVGISSDT